MIEHQKLVELYGKDALGFFYTETDFMTDGRLDDYEGFFDSHNLPCPEQAPDIWQPSYQAYLQSVYGSEYQIRGNENDYVEWLKVLENDKAQQSCQGV